MRIFPRKGSINFVFVFSGPSVEESCFHGTFNAGLNQQDFVQVTLIFLYYALAPLLTPDYFC